MASRSPRRLLALALLSCCASRATAAATTVESESAPLSAQSIGVMIAFIAQRRTNEATARLLDENLDDIDVRLLTDEELDLAPVNLLATKVSFPRELSPDWKPKVVSSSHREYRYFLPIDGGEGAPIATVELKVDESRPAPAIEVDLTDPLYPVVSVPKAFGVDGTETASFLSSLFGLDGDEALYYFEIDTSPRFDSPNLWQYPALMPLNYASTDLDQNDSTLQDLTGRDGLSFNVFHTRQRNADGHENQLRFPFRSTAMRLPNDWSKLSFEELERHALALAYGLNSTDAIGEVYRYGRQTWTWGDDTRDRNAIGVFQSGIGECNAINGLLGAILEMNGMRVRNIAAFDPKYRTVFGAGGHSAIEVRDPTTRQWSYVDSFLDLLLIGTSADQLASQRNDDSEFPIIDIYRRDWEKIFGNAIPLRQILKYTKYGDSLLRLPSMSRLRLRAGPGVDRYGSTWELNTIDPRPAAELFEANQTIYVRARYVFPGAVRIHTLGSSEKSVKAPSTTVATPWATTSFDISPRQLMSRYPVPEPPIKRNVCADSIVEPKVLAGPFGREAGHAFIIDIIGVGPTDSADHPGSSPMIVCENAKLLGPAHSIHEDIRQLGHGRFSHWNDYLIFSTSDNTDPNTNGRSYTVVRIDRQQEPGATGAVR